LLGDGDGASGEGDVVIGGEQSDQAKGKTADGLAETEPIKARPGKGWCWVFWRSQRLLAAGWRSVGAGGWGHGSGSAAERESSKREVPPGRRIITVPQGSEAAAVSIQARWPRPMGQRLRSPKRTGAAAGIHRHLHGSQQEMRIASGEGRPGPGDQLSEAKTVQRHLHRRLRSTGEEEFTPARAITLNRDVAGERPLVEQ